MRCVFLREKITIVHGHSVRHCFQYHYLCFINIFIIVVIFQVLVLLGRFYIKVKDKLCSQKLESLLFVNFIASQQQVLNGGWGRQISRAKKFRYFLFSISFGQFHFLHSFSASLACLQLIKDQYEYIFCVFSFLGLFYSLS